MNKQSLKTIILSSLLIPTLIACGSDWEDNNQDNQSNKSSDQNIAGLFTDKNLQSCINFIASNANPQWKTTNQIVGTVNCSGKSIVNLDGIQHLTNITELNLSDNKIENVSQIADLTKIKVVRLQNNAIGKTGVGNVNKLVSLTAAQDINFAGNPTISCNELGTLVTQLNSTSNPAELEKVNPEPYQGVNCS